MIIIHGASFPLTPEKNHKNFLMDIHAGCDRSTICQMHECMLWHSVCVLLQTKPEHFVYFDPDLNVQAVIFNQDASL